MGPAGNGANAPEGTVIFLTKGSVMPAGYVYIGSTKHSVPGFGPIEMDMYLKGTPAAAARFLMNGKR